MSGDWEKLWTCFVKWSGDNLNLSDSFKDLIEQLLHPVPMERSNFTQIKELLRFIGECATQEEIINEMSVRKLKVVSKTREDAETIDGEISEESYDFIKD